MKHLTLIALALTLCTQAIAWQPRTFPRRIIIDNFPPEPRIIVLPAYGFTVWFIL